MGVVLNDEIGAEYYCYSRALADVPLPWVNVVVPYPLLPLFVAVVSSLWGTGADAPILNVSTRF